MADRTHTPGPWIILDFAHGNNVPGTLVDSEPTGKRIATIEWLNAEWIANARLIAAAPDMLATLQKIERWFGEFPATGRTWEKSGEAMSYASCFGSNGERDFMREVARAAIAKATSALPDRSALPQAQEQL